ncbi:MAG: hypothetical protein WC919_01825 [Candidatus Paceibacterota bacterium]|jgi:hypothetical protein
MSYNIEAIRTEIRKKLAEPSTKPQPPWVKVEWDGRAWIPIQCPTYPSGQCSCSTDSTVCGSCMSHEHYVEGRGYFIQCTSIDKGLDNLPSPVLHAPKPVGK